MRTKHTWPDGRCNGVRFQRPSLGVVRSPVSQLACITNQTQDGWMDCLVTTFFRIFLLFCVLYLVRFPLELYSVI